MMDKVKVARSFSRSAATYDQVAYLQREVGESLLELLQQSEPVVETSVNTAINTGNCLDLGCGTGFFRKRLQALHGVRHYIGLDIAEGMLRFAVSPNIDKPMDSSRTHWVCADAESLPFAREGFDLIYSNMALQWCDNLLNLFAGVYDSLAPGGLMALTTLGPQTLCELKAAWARVDEQVHVNDFTHKQHWRSAMESCGLLVEQQHSQLRYLEYQSVMTLLKELKLLGAHNINDGQPTGLTSPKRLQRLLAAYEQAEGEDNFIASYEVDYWLLRKPIS